MLTAQPPQSPAKLPISLMQVTFFVLFGAEAHSVMAWAHLPHLPRIAPLPNLQSSGLALMLDS